MSKLDIYNRYKTDISRWSVENFKGTLYLCWLWILKCRNEYKGAMQESKKSYNYELIDRSSQKCKTIWKVINKVAKSYRFSQNQNDITVHL